MKPTTVIPGLTITEHLYEAAVAGIAVHVPGHPLLSREQFTTPRAWWLVPDDHGIAYKAELVLRNDPARTIKINLWIRADRRGSEEPQPHNHPWAFTSHILTGGYTEDRYTLVGGQVRTETGVSRTAGSANAISRTDYHEVTAVHEPHGTLSLMVCGPGRPGTWGYLDLDTARHVPALADHGFLDRLRALNPHQP
ncbi:hypothetical protein [Streptomyces sp. NPDC050485]|uniref:hypothetical protein n=1 Tax=Streptomyces sp. NPDC050485 TaxID=3365617 RepID=UPI0037A07BAD